MNYPCYVPEAAGFYISELLEGPMGWQEALDSAEEALASIPRDRINSDEHRKRLAEAQEYRDELAESVACLKRLLQDHRMKEPYDLLASEFTEKEQWERFIHAAWGTNLDYSTYRDSLKRAAELTQKIGKTADKLAKLIRQTGDTGYSFFPSEFFSVEQLLRETQSGENRPTDMHLWKGLKGHLFGDLPRTVTRKPASQEPNDGTLSIQIVTVSEANIDPLEKNRASTKYIWGIAPKMPACLETMARVALQFKPTEAGVIGAAIGTRQRNIKTEYIRAFGQIVTESQELELGPIMMKAMASVANVVINLPEVDVTYDDVRKALQSG